MENMDRLDEFMQRKFAKDDPEQRLAFREEYWLQAQALIDAADRRQKRRRLFWWWAGGGLGLALIALGWWMIPAQLDAPAHNPVTQTKPAVPDAGMPYSPTATGQRPDQAGKTSVATDNPSETTQAFAKPRPEAQASNITETSEPANRNLPSTRDKPGQPSRPSDKPAETAPLITGALPGQPRVAAAVPSAIEAGRGGQTTPRGLGMKPRATEPLAEVRSVTHPDQLAQSSLLPATPDAATPSRQDPVSIPTDAPAPLIVATPEPKLPNTDVPTPLAAPELLPLPLATLPFELRPLNFPGPLEKAERQTPNLERPTSPQPVATPTERYHDWRYRIGVTAGVSTRSGYLSAEKPGTIFGLTNSIHRNGALVSLHADLLWRRRPGGHSDAELNPRSEQLRYSFGYVLDLTEDRVTAVHWLEFPMYVQFHWRQFRASAGIAPALLLAVYGREEHTRQTSLQPDPVLIGSEKVRVNDHLFKPGGISILTGIDWQATNRFSLGMRLHYQPGAIQRAPVDWAGPYTAPARQAFWGEARVTYTLFNAK